MHCKQCEEDKPLTSFYTRSGGVGYRQPCKACVWPTTTLICRLCGSDFTTKRVKHSAMHNLCKTCYPIKRRGDSIYAAAKSRASQGKYEFNLSKEWVEKGLLGLCPMLGVPFELNATGRSYKDRHPLTPSIDKIDPDKGYTEDNCRIVSWWYNLAKAKYKDEEVLEFCKRVVNLSATKAAKDVGVRMQ